MWARGYGYYQIEGHVACGGIGLFSALLFRGLYSTSRNDGLSAAGSICQHAVSDRRRWYLSVIFCCCSWGHQGVLHPGRGGCYFLIWRSCDRNGSIAEWLNGSIVYEVKEWQVLGFLTTSTDLPSQLRWLVRKGYGGWQRWNEFLVFANWSFMIIRFSRYDIQLCVYDRNYFRFKWLIDSEVYVISMVGGYQVRKHPMICRYFHIH